MQKKTLAFIALCVTTILSANVIAQKVSPKAEQLQATTKKVSIAQKYIDFSSLPSGENRKVFNGLSANDKAALFRFHLSLQLVKRQSLTSAQKDLILEALSLILPDLYAENKERDKIQQNLESLMMRAKALFTPKEVFEIFGNLGSPEDLVRLKKYENLSPYDLESRRQMFKDSTVIEKADAWEIHCAVFLTERPEMNAYQRAFIVELFAFISPETFEIRADNPKWESMVGKPSSELLKRGQQLFSKEETIMLLSELGGARGASSLRTPESPADDCQCNRGSGDLCAYGCVGTNCTVWTLGCGPFWVWTCNGAACNPIPQEN